MANILITRRLRYRQAMPRRPNASSDDVRLLENHGQQSKVMPQNAGAYCREGQISHGVRRPYRMPRWPPMRREGRTNQNRVYDAADAAADAENTQRDFHFEYFGIFRYDTLAYMLGVIMFVPIRAYWLAASPISAACRHSRSLRGIMLNIRDGMIFIAYASREAPGIMFQYFTRYFAFRSSTFITTRHSATKCTYTCSQSIIIQGTGMPPGTSQHHGTASAAARKVK